MNIQGRWLTHLISSAKEIVQKSCSCDFLHVLVVCQEICGIVLKFYLHLAISLQITPLSIAGLTKKQQIFNHQLEFKLSSNNQNLN